MKPYASKMEPGLAAKRKSENQMVAYRILQLIPAPGWEVELAFDDGHKEVHPLIGMALIERVDDHGDWYREVVGIFPRADGSGFCTVYDYTRVLDLTYRQQGKNPPPGQQ